MIRQLHEILGLIVSTNTSSRFMLKSCLKSYIFFSSHFIKDPVRDCVFLCVYTTVLILMRNIKNVIHCDIEIRYMVCSMLKSESI